jgi:hypothetical protein
VAPRSLRQFGPAVHAIGAFLLVAVLIFGSIAPLGADPGAASFALGGLQFRKEPRISMVKENLKFEDETPDDSEIPGVDIKVTAEYEFQNLTDQAVTIAMAFPLPDDVCSSANSPFANFAEDSFHVWVEGRERKYGTEARAFGSSDYYPTSTSDPKKDYTGVLRDFGIEADSCKPKDSMAQAAKAKLVTLGLLDKETNTAIWTVRRKYYWTQAFPAGKITHIKVEYPAQVGYTDVYLGKGWDKGVVQGSEEFWTRELKRTCGGAGLQKKVVGQMSQPDSFVKAYWLDFILVTANYWNGPIKDFALTVKTSNPNVNFCWDGPVKRTDAKHIVATAHDFSPTRDLHIGIFEVY